MSDFSMSEMLGRHTNFVLSRLMALVPPPPDSRRLPTRKDEMLAWLTRLAREPETLADFWSRLTELERDALAAAVHDPATPGRLDARAFLVKHGGLPRRSSDYVHDSALDARSVTRMAVCFTEEYAVPGDLAEALRRLVPSPPDQGVRAWEALPEVEVYVDELGKQTRLPLTAVSTEPHAFHDLLAVLGLIEAGLLKVSPSTQAPVQSTLKAVNAVLSQPEYPGTIGAESLRAAESIRTHSLVSLMLATEWAGVHKQAPGKLALSPEGEAFLRAPSPERLMQALEAWVDDPLNDELLRLDGLHGMSTVAAGAAPPSDRRIALLNTLCCLPFGVWLDVEDVFRASLITGNHFDVETTSHSQIFTGAYGHWNNAPLGRTDSEVYWRVVKCQVMLVMMFESLASFGLLDVAYLPSNSRVYYKGLHAPSGLHGVACSHCEGLRFIRVNPLGAYLLRQANSYAGPVALQAAGPALRVLPNQQVMLMARRPGSAAGHPVLTKFCDRDSDDAYRLSADKLLRLFEAGDMSPADVVAYLERESGAPLPQTVSEMLADVARRSDLLELAGEALVFRARDHALALLLGHDRALQKLGCLRAGDDRIVVPKAQAAAFRRRVRELGYGIKDVTV